MVHFAWQFVTGDLYPSIDPSISIYRSIYIHLSIHILYPSIDLSIIPIYRSNFYTRLSVHLSIHLCPSIYPFIPIYRSIYYTHLSIHLLIHSVYQPIHQFIYSSIPIIFFHAYIYSSISCISQSSSRRIPKPCPRQSPLTLACL